MLVVKPEDTLIPGFTWHKERNVSYKLSFDLHTNTYIHMNKYKTIYEKMSTLIAALKAI